MFQNNCYQCLFPLRSLGMTQLQVKAVLNGSISMCAVKTSQTDSMMCIFPHVCVYLSVCLCVCVCVCVWVGGCGCTHSYCIYVHKQLHQMIHLATANMIVGITLKKCTPVNVLATASCGAH